MNLGTPVALPEIEATLKKLWEADEAQTNASLTNFAIYSEKPDDLEANSEIIQNLTREHACRALLLAVDRNAENTDAQAWVTAHCHLAHGKKSVCCEQIAFRLNGITPGRLNNTLFAHLHSDLPLILWWQGDLTSAFRENLYTLIDRLIVDGMSWSNPAEGYTNLSEAMEKAGSSLVTQDLAWSRTYTFRTSLASLFDEPLALQALPKLTEISITTNPHTHLLAQWMIAYMAHQAGWSIKSATPEKVELIGDNFQNIVAHIIIEDGCDSLRDVTLTSPDTIIQLNRPSADKQAYLCQKLTHNGQCIVNRTAPIDSISRPRRMLANQLARGGKNSLYKSILPVLRKLL